METSIDENGASVLKCISASIQPRGAAPAPHPSSDVGGVGGSVGEPLVNGNDHSDVEVMSARQIPTHSGVMFTCQICFATILGRLGSTEFILDHFSRVHQKFNVKIHHLKDEQGRTVIKCIEAPPPPPPEPSTLPESAPLATAPPVLRINCHLCGVQIQGSQWSSDFIADHFRVRHDVHNIRLHQSVDAAGQPVVNIVQDGPTKIPANNGTSSSSSNNDEDIDTIDCID